MQSVAGVILGLYCVKIDECTGVHVCVQPGTYVAIRPTRAGVALLL